MIKHNKYFDEKVQSLAYSNTDGKFSTGVMLAGNYTFGTGAPEKMTLVQGAWKLKLPGETEFKSYGAGETVAIPGNASFDLEIEVDSAYLCEYL